LRWIDHSKGTDHQQINVSESILNRYK